MTTQYTHSTHDQNQSPVQQYHDLQSGHGYIISVSHSPNRAELRTLSNVERGAQPRVQHYQRSQQGLARGMGH